MVDVAKPVNRYSKPFGQLAKFKRGLFDSNAAQLKRSLDLAAVYRAQPRRLNCKICATELPAASGFIKHGVPYVFCEACGHLNGCHEDTEAYAKHVYVEADYGAAYHSDDGESYLSRVREIYLPKARFLIEQLKSLGEEPSNLVYADLGAGSGHFVGAMAELGLDVHGAELSASQVAYGNAALGHLQLPPRPDQTERLVHVGLEGGLEVFSAECQADVVSLIGVLEHLVDPHALLRALRDNRRVRYLFLSLPLYSLSVLIEAAFPEVAPRLLEGGHTHLFCERSLNAHERRNGLDRLAAWRFGSDSMDLFRALRFVLAGKPDTAGLVAELETHMGSMLDELQAAIDRADFCSEIHLLYAIRR